MMTHPTAFAGTSRSLVLALATAFAGCSGDGSEPTGSSTDADSGTLEPGTTAPTTGASDDPTTGPSPSTGTNADTTDGGTTDNVTTGPVTTGDPTTGPVTTGDTTTGNTTTEDTTTGDDTTDDTTGGLCAHPLVPGNKTEKLTVDGVERSYLVVVPASLEQGVAAPVLLGFHGGNGTSEYASEAYGLTGDEPALYVYPQAPYWREAGGVAWNVDPDGVDFPYFDAMIADLADKYCIDPARIFAAGQSNGGFFVNALACYRPEVIRAIAPVAGGGPPGQCVASTITMFGVHGKADDVVPIGSGEFARDYWRAANGCAGSPGAPVDPAPCVTYEGCAEPVVWCAHDGGHPWPAFAGPAIRGFFLSL